MPTLTIAAITNYSVAPASAQVDGKNITDIVFSAPSGTTVATFGSAQFGGGSISSSVVINGGGGSNIFQVLVSSGSLFSAAGWTLNAWAPAADYAGFSGASGAETITGTSANDRFSGLAGADSLAGGDGDDEFGYSPGEAPAGEAIDGGSGNDRVAVFSGTVDFTAASFTSIEAISFNTGGTAILNAAQANGLTSVQGAGGAQSITISGTASHADLSDLAFTAWTAGTDTIAIVATGAAAANTFIGSSQADTITVLAGAAATNTLQGGGGADTLTGANAANQINVFDYAALAELSAGERINGQALSADTIRVAGAGDFDFRNSVLASIETLDFDAGISGVSAAFNASQFGAGLSTSLKIDGGSAADVLRIYLEGKAFSAAGFTFTNFTPGADAISLQGSATAESITGASIANIFIGGGGADTLTGGADNDKFTYSNPGEIAAGESLLGGGGSDVILVAGGLNYDFSAVSLSGIEGVSLMADKFLGASSVIFAASQFGTGLSTSLAVEGGAGGPYTLTVNGILSVFSASAWTFAGGFDEGDAVALNGGINADTITGSSHSDSISGGGGVDDLAGGGGSDTLNGGADNDTLTGGDGADVLIGFSGSDTASYSDAPSGVVIFLDTSVTAGSHAAGDSFLDIETLIGSAFNDSLFGTNSANALTGLAGIDYLEGFGGNDTLDGGAGDDVLSGGADNDTLAGGADNDQLFGGPGDDVLLESSGINILNGGAGLDTLTGGASDDYLYGGADSDFLVGGAGNDNLYGEDGGDQLIDMSGINIFNGLAGDDTLSGGELDDYFYGGADDDQISTGGGINAAAGEDGNDTIFGGAGANALQGNAGDDSITGGSGADYLEGNGGNDTIGGGLGTNVIDGGDGADSLTGGGNTDAIRGGAGDDIIFGLSGDDYLYGGAGADTIEAGSGNDVIFLGSDSAPLADGAADRADFAPGSGIDALYGFEAGAAGGDVIRLAGTGYSSFAQIMASTYDFAGYSVIVVAPGTEVYVYGVQKADYAADDFLLI